MKWRNKIEKERRPKRDLSSLCKACRADYHKATMAFSQSRLYTNHTFVAFFLSFLNNLDMFNFLETNQLPFHFEFWSLSTGQQSCSAAVTSSQTRAPWTTSSCGPMGRSRCLSWTYLCWTSGSVCQTCGRLWPVPCRSNPATASLEGVSYASMSPAILQLTSYHPVVTNNMVAHDQQEACWCLHRFFCKRYFDLSNLVVNTNTS